MKIYYELDLLNFHAWSGAKDTLDELTYYEIKQLEAIIEGAYEEMDETELNDLLWFEADAIADWLGYSSWEALEKVHRYGNEVTVYINNICWDINCDDNSNLPTEITQTFDYNGDDDELAEIISEWLSDEYGYCHNGFIWRHDE